MIVDRRLALSQLGAALVGMTLPQEQPALLEGLCGPRAPEGFEGFCFTDAEGRQHQVYTIGRSGPPVLLLHELPGLIDADLETARRLAAAEYRVIAPLLFGEPGGKGSALRHARRVCGDEQFACGRSEVTSPHVRWLLQLCDIVGEQWKGGKGLGVIGMCLTGAFPIALMRSRAVVAPVLCQPTLPFNLWTRFGWFTDKRGLGLHPEDLAAARRRQDIPLLGIRYKGDWRCRKERFQRLTEEFEDRFFRLDLEGRHHSTLGGNFCPEAFTEVLAFFNRHLRATPVAGLPAFPVYSRPNSLVETGKLECCTSPPHGSS